MLRTGVVRNITESGQSADSPVDMVLLINEFTLPLINRMLDINLQTLSDQVMQLVVQTVITFPFSEIFRSAGPIL